MREPAVQVKNISKAFRLDADRVTTFKEVLVRLATGRKKDPPRMWQVLNDVSFTVSKGEFVGIMGRNGAGKSTILKMMCGIYKPDKGSITTFGQIAPLIELGAGFVGDLNGIENIYLNASILGYGRKSAAALLPKIMEFSELGEHLEKPVKNYSSGMVIRLAFSIAAHVSSPILLVDEVLAVGDVDFQIKCLNRILELKKEGRTIILVSHDPESVRRHCDRCIVIENAKVAFDGPAGLGADYYLGVFKRPAELSV